MPCAESYPQALVRSRAEPAHRDVRHNHRVTIEDNKAVVRRFVQEVFVEGREASVDELVATDFVPRSWPGVGAGREPLKEAQRRIRAGLSDVAMAIEDIIAEGDRVAVRLTSSARQTGEFAGMPPSGKAYSVSETHIFRLRDGQVIEHWRDMDRFDLMRQLGAAP
jgi:predicted ester cyclase